MPLNDLVAKSAPSLAPLPSHFIDAAVRLALDEDLGRAGDITSQAVIPVGAQSEVTMRARKNGCIAGSDAARAAFKIIDPNIQFAPERTDGDTVSPGDVIARISGASRGILTAERVALNFLGHLSGVATETQALVRAIDGTSARICCTRKTTPGLRALEKHAVLAGGGVNHRFGLDDAILIKDNHIAMAGGVTAALKAAQNAAGHMVAIEIEVDNLAQLEEALAAGAKIVLLDNMPPETLKEAVALTAGRAILEASGNITLETVKPVAESGVGFVSVGWITHSAPCLDIGLDFEVSR